jgi:hypothetical protein
MSITARSAVYKRVVHGHYLTQTVRDHGTTTYAPQKIQAKLGYYASWRINMHIIIARCSARRSGRRQPSEMGGIGPVA